MRATSVTRVAAASWLLATLPGAGALTERIRPLLRSVTNAVPSGRNASAHGTDRPVATVSTASTGTDTGTPRADGFVKIRPKYQATAVPAPITATSTTTPTASHRARSFGAGALI
jgi:hypothetical protein